MMDAEKAYANIFLCHQGICIPEREREQARTTGPTGKRRFRFRRINAWKFD